MAFGLRAIKTLRTSLRILASPSASATEDNGCASATPSASARASVGLRMALRIFGAPNARGATRLNATRSNGLRRFQPESSPCPDRWVQRW